MKPAILIAAFFAFTGAYVWGAIQVGKFIARGLGSDPVDHFNQDFTEALEADVTGRDR